MYVCKQQQIRWVRNDFETPEDTDNEFTKHTLD